MCARDAPSLAWSAQAPRLAASPFVRAAGCGLRRNGQDLGVAASTSQHKEHCRIGDASGLHDLPVYPPKTRSPGLRCRAGICEHNRR